MGNEIIKAKADVVKPPSQNLSHHIDKFVNYCRNIRKNVVEAYEEYNVCLRIGREEQLGDYATNMLIRQRMAPVGDNKTILKVMNAMGVKGTMFITPEDKRHPRKTKDPDLDDDEDPELDEDPDEDDEYEDEEEDDEDEDEEDESFTQRCIIDLHPDIFKKIFLAYTNNKEEGNDDDIIKLVIEVRSSIKDVKIFGGSILSVKK